MRACDLTHFAIEGAQEFLNHLDSRRGSAAGHIPGHSVATA
jgi:hypothetical protein